MKKNLRNWVASALTWEDKDIPNLVAQIGGPAPERANAISLQQPDVGVAERLQTSTSSGTYRQNHDF